MPEQQLDASDEVGGEGQLVGVDSGTSDPDSVT